MIKGRRRLDIEHIVGYSCHCYCYSLPYDNAPRCSIKKLKQERVHIFEDFALTLKFFRWVENVHLTLNMSKKNNNPSEKK